MTTHTISTKELREELPRIREGIRRGQSYTVIYRSKPFAELHPINQPSVKSVKLKGGTLNFTQKLGRELTPELINDIALTKYD
jgi:antitoxin (DNA-binding transcriptional repressor) of toxin-antitoxin stability system